MFMPLVASTDSGATHSAAMGVSLKKRMSACMVGLLLGVVWMREGTRCVGSPAGQQPALDHLAGPLLEGAVALGDAIAAADVELPLVLGAGQRAAFERQVGDVGGLVRAAAVVDPPFDLGAVHEPAG